MVEIADYAPTLPRAVQEQIRRANQLARDAGIANVPDDANPLPVITTVEPTPEVTPVVTETPAAPDQTAQLDQPQLPLETPPQPQQTEPAPQPQPVDWEQRYNTLQGKYNTELPELRGQVKNLQEMLTNLSRLPNGEQNIPRAPQRTAPPVQIPQADVDNYGPELIAAAQRWADAKYAPVMADYERRLTQVEGNTQHIAQVSVARGVEGVLDQQVPHWRQINVDPLFIEWLGQQDPFSGRPRKDLITEAYGNGDAPRTIAFFHAFQREQTAVSPTPSGTHPGQTGNGAMSVAPAATVPLANLAVPGRGQLATPPASSAPGKRQWTGAQITALYDQKRRGLWNGREAEFDALERDIIAAPLEGRIRG